MMALLKAAKISYPHKFALNLPNGVLMHNSVYEMVSDDCIKRFILESL